MKKQISLMCLLVLFAISTSFAQEKATTSVIQKVMSVDPVGRLSQGGVFIGPDGEVHIWCVCVAPYDEWCLTRHNYAIQREYTELISSKQSSSKQSSTKKQILPNLNLTEFEATLVSADKNQRVYVLNKKNK